MNAIFASQTLEIPIDVCVLGDGISAQKKAVSPRRVGAPQKEQDENRGSTALHNYWGEQAAHITKGVHVSSQPQLLQQLIYDFLAPPTMRSNIIVTSSTEAVDFRASCFCHGRLVDR